MPVMLWRVFAVFAYLGLAVLVGVTARLMAAVKRTQTCLRRWLHPPTKLPKQRRHTPDCCCVGLQCFEHCACRGFKCHISAVLSSAKAGHRTCLRYLVKSGAPVDDWVLWHTISRLSLDDVKLLFETATNVPVGRMHLAEALASGKMDTAVYLRAEGALPITGIWMRNVKDDDMIWAARNDCLDQTDWEVVARMCRLFTRSAMSNAVAAYRRDCAASAIQGAWRRAYYNPGYAVCRRRVVRQFAADGGRLSRLEKVMEYMDDKRRRLRRRWAAFERRVMTEF